MLISEDGQRFGFHKRELALLTSMMAGEDRETLAAVWFHPAKGQAWATDGNRAVMAERDVKPPKAPAGCNRSVRDHRPGAQDRRPAAAPQPLLLGAQFQGMRASTLRSVPTRTSTSAMYTSGFTSWS